MLQHTERNQNVAVSIQDINIIKEQNFYSFLKRLSWHAQSLANQTTWRSVLKRPQGRVLRDSAITWSKGERSTCPSKLSEPKLLRNSTKVIKYVSEPSFSSVEPLMSTALTYYHKEKHDIAKPSQPREL